MTAPHSTRPTGFRAVLAANPVGAKILFVFLALLYVLSPLDLIPDFFGLPGRLDDIAVLFYLYVMYKRILVERVKPTAQTTAQSSTQKHPNSPPPERPRRPSAHEVLGVPITAGKEEIDAAYRKLASLYHPDKVNHLGPDLQKLAHEKMVEIQLAYKSLA